MTSLTTMEARLSQPLLEADKPLTAAHMLAGSPVTAASSTSLSSSSSPFSMSLSISSPCPSPRSSSLLVMDDEDDRKSNRSATDLSFADLAPPSPTTTTPPNASSHATSTPPHSYPIFHHSDSAECLTAAAEAGSARLSSSSPPTSSLSSESCSPRASGDERSSRVCVLLDDYTCCICLSLMVDPVTLHCQHSYCRHCLVQCFELSSKRCPSCRAPSDPSLVFEHAHPNALLINLLKAAFPRRYARREALVRPIRDAWANKLAVYSSAEILFPYQSLLLNMHEARYALLMQRLQRVSSGPRCFALVGSGGAASEGSVGVVCEVLGDCVSDSGAVQVNAKGRCLVQSLWVEEGTHGLAYARVEMIDDVDEASTSSPSAYQAQVADAVQRIHGLIHSHDSLSPQSFHVLFGTVPSSPHELSFWIFQALAVDAGVVSVDPWLAAEVMTSRSLLWRLNVGEDLLHESIQALAQRRQRQMGDDASAARRRFHHSRTDSAGRAQCLYAGGGSSYGWPPPPLHVLTGRSPATMYPFGHGRGPLFVPEEHKAAQQLPQPPPILMPPPQLQPSQEWNHGQGSGRSQGQGRRPRHQYSGHRYAQRTSQPPPPHPWLGPVPGPRDALPPQYRPQAPNVMRGAPHAFHAYRPPSLNPSRSASSASLPSSSPPQPLPLLGFLSAAPPSPPSPFPASAAESHHGQQQPATSSLPGYRPYSLF